MAIKLNELYITTQSIYQLALVAGSQGLSNIVNWVYVAEDPGAFGFLNENELIISTAMLYDHTENWLMSLIMRLIEKKCSGLILNTGKYVSLTDITPDMISLCNKHSFPLLIMPWHIHISDITKDFCDRILSDNNQNDRIGFYQILSEIKNKLILEKYSNDLLAPILKYDQKHNSNFINTLQAYLKYRGSIIDIAKECYCHRNTAANRIHIIENLGYNLEDPNLRFELMCAFAIRDYLNSSI
ncbi:MAG: PucR family transcriptional regulator ligand-binding domain-containing protein [Lachnospiraceae bacterium]|nr:PucR family transcriptional regulator ligand-binding domain-containing protein [Lachnospiraceae bacterium]